MSYAAPRPAKLKIEVTSKNIGKGGALENHRAGKKVQVQRSPAEPGFFIIWFSKYNIAKIPAEQLQATIEYTDGKPEGFNY